MAEMDEREFKRRTKRAALEVLALVERLPTKRMTVSVIARQLARCGTSVGENYRASCRGKSLPDVISKLGDAEEEADETLYWMELLVEGGYIQESEIAPLYREYDEILAMLVASIKTLRKRLELEAEQKRDRQQAPKSKI